MAQEPLGTDEDFPPRGSPIQQCQIGPLSCSKISFASTCNLQYSFNLTKGIGRTNGEVPERGWANINPAAQSTKEMGLGSRHDTLDDHFGDWNWKKMIKLGKVFFHLHASGQPLTLYVW